MFACCFLQAKFYNRLVITRLFFFSFSSCFCFLIVNVYDNACGIQSVCADRFTSHGREISLNLWIHCLCMGCNIFNRRNTTGNYTSAIYFFTAITSLACSNMTMRLKLFMDNLYDIKWVILSYWLGSKSIMSKLSYIIVSNMFLNDFHQKIIILNLFNH